MGHPHLILLPGLDGTGIPFASFLAALPDDIDRTVISYPTDQRLTLPRYAHLVSRQLPREDVALLAESFSGMVALTLLAGGAPQVRYVIFAACAAVPPRPLILRGSRLVPGLGTLLRAAPAVGLRWLCLGQQASTEQVHMLRGALATVQPEVLAHRLRLLGKPQPFLPQRFPVPCCYLQASRDRLLPRSSARWFQEHFASCELVRLRGPHFLLQAAPRECAQVVIDRLLSLPTPA